jgi:DNA-binding MarR family transcriptional regulator
LSWHILTVTESGLRDHIGYWLRRLSDEVHTRFERQLLAHGVTVAQWNVLVALYHHEATTTTEVARFIDIDPGAVSRLVDRLVDKGLMTRSPDPTSRRQLHLSLTPSGQALVPVLSRLADENDATFFGELSSAERAGLMRLLQRLLPAHSSSRQESSDA